MNLENFKDQFQLPFNDFEEPVVFTDNNFGFSVMKKYGDGYASLFRIYVPKGEIESKDPIKNLVSTVSYGKETEGGITLSSSAEKIRNLFDPINLRSTDFSYDSHNNRFFYNDKEINPKKILEYLDEWHTKPTYPWRGLLIRIKIVWYWITPMFFKALFWLLAKLEYVLSGKKVKIFYNLEDLRSNYKKTIKESVDTDDDDPISIFGYKVKKGIAFVYSFIHLLVYFIFGLYKYKPDWLEVLFSNIFLTVMYVIFSLGFFNDILPALLKPNYLLPILKRTQRQYIKYSGKSFKV